MSFVVTAGRVSAETQVHERGGRAVVDFYRGAVLPEDVPDEQVQSFVRLGHVEPVEDEPVDEPTVILDDDGEEDAPDSEDDGDDESDDLAGLDKDALVEIADKEGVTLDGRWGADKIADAIRENRQ